MNIKLKSVSLPEFGLPVTEPQVAPERICTGSTGYGMPCVFRG